VTGFCFGVAVGAVLLAATIAIGGHLLIEVADGRLVQF
jgi:hypothetical protein